MLLWFFFCRKVPCITAIISKKSNQPCHRPLKDSPKESTLHQKKKRFIRFAKYDEVRVIPHVNDFSDEQISDCYYGHDELRAIRKHCAVIVSHVNKQGTSGGDGFFLRGLDQHTIEYKRTQDSRSKALYDTLKQVQREEKLTGRDLSEKLAKELNLISESSVVAAHVAAISDLFSSFKGTWTKAAQPVIRDIPNKPATPMAVSPKSPQSVMRQWQKGKNN